MSLTKLEARFGRELLRQVLVHRCILAGQEVQTYLQKRTSGAKIRCHSGSSFLGIWGSSRTTAEQDRGECQPSQQRKPYGRMWLDGALCGRECSKGRGAIPTCH